MSCVNFNSNKINVELTPVRARAAITWKSKRTAMKRFVCFVLLLLVPCVYTDAHYDCEHKTSSQECVSNPARMHVTCDAGETIMFSMCGKWRCEFAFCNVAPYFDNIQGNIHSSHSASNSWRLIPDTIGSRCFMFKVKCLTDASFDMGAQMQAVGNDVRRLVAVVLFTIEIMGVYPVRIPSQSLFLPYTWSVSHGVLFCFVVFVFLLFFKSMTQRKINTR